MYFFCTYFAGCDREWSEVQLSKAKIVLTGKYCRLSTSQKSFSTVFPWTLGRIVVIQGEDSSSGQTGFTRRKACRDLPQQWPGMYQGYQRLSPLCLIRFPQHISKALNGVVSLSWGVNELNLPWHPCCPDNPPSTMELLMKRTTFENVASGWQWMLFQQKKTLGKMSNKKNVLSSGRYKMAHLIGQTAQYISCLHLSCLPPTFWLYCPQNSLFSPFSLFQPNVSISFSQYITCLYFSPFSPIPLTSSPSRS